jgi:toxin ParE1/3/4
MALRLIVRPEAELDIESSALRYEGQQRGLGSRFLDTLNDIFARVTENPFRFPQLERNVRRALLDRFPYGIYFLPESNRVVVIAVLHLHRHPDTWRRRT